jgi:NTP pyrophosphatase (non-canonical NTP hydrolase)
MDLKEIQKEAYKIVDEYNQKHNLEYDKETVFFHLIEEIGELARHIHNEKNKWRKEEFDKEKLGEEIIDVLAQLLYLSRDYGIDLEQTFIKKVKKTRKKYGLD